MATTTRNVPLTGEWQEINFTLCSNPSQTPIPDVTVKFRATGAILTVTVKR